MTGLSIHGGQRGMVKPRVENVEHISFHKQGGVQHRVIHDRRTPKSSTEGWTNRTQIQSTAGGTAQDKDPHLSRHSGSYQVATAYRHWPLAVAGKIHHQEGPIAEGTSNRSGGPLGTRSYVRRGERNGRRSGQGGDGESRQTKLSRDVCLTRSCRMDDLKKILERG